MSRGFYSDGIDASMDWSMAIGAGKIPTARREAFSAISIDSPEGAYSLMSPSGTMTTSTAFPDDNGESLTIETTDIADAGSLVRVVGLDENFEIAEQDVVLTGLSTPIPGTWTRINSTLVLFKAIVGTLTVEGVNVYDEVRPEDQRSLVGRYSAPTNKYTQLLGLTASMNKSSGPAGSFATIRVLIRLTPGGPLIFAFSLGFQRNGTSTFQLVEQIPLAFASTTDFVYEVLPTGADTDMSITVPVVLQDKV